MSSSIDTRIVEARFDGSKFASGVSSVLSALAKLKDGLQMRGATSGLEQINTAGNKVRFDGLQQGINGVMGQFSMLQVAAITAFSNIVNSAVDAGKNIVTALSGVGPMKDGYSDYEAKLTSVQTIMNATGEDIKVVEGYFKQLDEYADKTIYNLTDMTSAFAKFTNNGVKMETSVPAIQGIANSVAHAGQGAGAATVAYYNLSQAIANGYLTRPDFKSIEMQNVATITWKNHMLDAAVAAGELTKKSDGMYTIQAQGNKKAYTASQLWIDGMQEGWATSEVLLDVYGQYADVTTKIGREAFAAAQDVKTFGMMMETLKAGVGTGWTDTFDILFGNVHEAKALWTPLTLTIGEFVGNMADARNKLLQTWKDLGGREKLIEGLKTMFVNLGKVVRPIIDAFREIFPKKTAGDLMGITNGFVKFAESLKPGKQLVEDIKSTFAGFFAIFSIFGQIIGGVIDGVKAFFSEFEGGGGSFLGATASLGDFLVALNDVIKESEFLKTFFQTLGKILALPVKLIMYLGSLIGKIFSGFDVDDAAEFKDSLESGKETLETMADAGKRVMAFFERVGEVLGKAGEKIGDVLADVGMAVGRMFTPENMNLALSALNTGLLGALVLMIKKFISGDGQFNFDFSGGLFNKIGDSFEAVTEALSVMQSNLKAEVLTKIAIALGIMAAAIWVLSTIDPEMLTRAMIGMMIGFGFLTKGLVLLVNGMGPKELLALPFFTLGLLALSSAILVMAAALKVMASMSWEELGKGMAAVAVGLGIMIGAVKIIPEKKMIASSIALNLMANALIILGVALKLFATMSWDELLRGGAALAGSLGAIAGIMWGMPPNMAMQAVALNLLASALVGIGVALRIFSTMEWDELLRGGAALAGSLAAIAAIMWGMPPNMLLQSIALIAVATALTIIAGALKLFSGMSWEEFAIGMAGLGGSLAILAAGLWAMNGSLLGSAALVIASTALAIMIPLLILMGTVGWGVILTGLAGLAGVFIVLGLAGLVLSPVILVILGLGAALLMIGAGLALAGAGALLFATAFALVATTGAMGVAVIAGIAQVLIAALVPAFKEFGKGIVALAEEVAKGGPAFFRAMATAIGSFLKAIEVNLPKIQELFVKMIVMGLATIITLTPRVVDAGLKMLLGFLRGIRDSIPQIVDVVGDIFIEFFDAVAKKGPEISDKGAKALIEFMDGMGKAIDDNAEEMGRAGVELAQNIVKGMVKGIAGGAKQVASAGWEMGKSALGGIGSALGINSPSKEFIKIGKFSVEGFAIGLTGNKEKIQGAVKEMYDQINTAMSNNSANWKSEKDKLASIWTDRVENIREVEKAIKDLEAARAREVGSDAKDAKTRAAEIKREGESKKKAIEAAEERVRKLNIKWAEYDKKVSESQKKLAGYEEENNKLRAARTALQKDLADESKALQTLADKNDKLTEKIKEATKAYEDARKVRDDYNKSISDQYGKQEDINKDTKLGSYIKNLEKQIVDTQQYAIAIQELRKRGLNDEVYKELLASGPEAMPFVQELLAGGSGAVKQINTLGKTLDKEANTLGTKAASALYQAGVDAAAGIVKGLEKQKSALEKQMENLADYMVNAIRKKLQIKSPSRVFAKLGAYSAQGLAKGLEQSAPAVKSSADQLGSSAIDAMRKSIAGLGDMIAADMDLDPVIKPVLDLSTIRRDAVRVGAMLGQQPLSVGATYSSAQNAAAGYASNQSAYSESDLGGETTVMNLTQINNSPKALSTAEIYRNTNNQLSVAKGALTK